MHSTHSLGKAVIGRMILFLAASAACLTAQRVFSGEVNAPRAREDQRIAAQNAYASGQNAKQAPFPTPTADKDMMARFVRQLRTAKNIEARRRIILAMKEWRKNHLAPVFHYDPKNEPTEDHVLPQVKNTHRMKTSRSRVWSMEAESTYHIPLGSTGNRIEFFIDAKEAGFSKDARIALLSAQSWMHIADYSQTTENRDTADGPACVRFDVSVDETAPVGKYGEVTVAVSTPTGERPEKKLRIIVDPPARFELLQNYPNPFNPSTTLSFVIGSSSLVTLKVYDVLGREVATLVNEVKQPGEYSVRWDAAQLSSGVYFARLSAGAFTETKKILLMR